MNTQPDLAAQERLIDELEGVGSKRVLGPIALYVVYITALAMAAFHVVVLASVSMDPWVFRICHLQFAMILGFLCFRGRAASVRPGLWDILFILMSLSSMVYILWDFEDLINRVGAFPEKYDMVFGLFAILTVLELTRRTVGWGLTLLAAVFLLYAFVGPYLPGILWHKGYSFGRIVSAMMSTNGIFNVPVGITARFVYLFILFGAFLELSGAAALFMDLAMVTAGSSRGGPAKVALVSSGLLGMVSGSPTSNVVTTGTVTIPLMKRTGYSSDFAGAVEACASTGGQLVPPVMGAAVFLMAQIMERPYAEIMVAAIIPALLYYVALYFTIDLEAARENLLGAKSDLRFKDMVPRLYMAIPLFVLVGLIMAGRSVVFAGLMGLALSVSVAAWHQSRAACPLLSRKGLLPFLDAVKNGSVGFVSIATTCAAAGMIMGVLSITGLGTKIATIVVDLSQGHLIVCLVLTMVVTIILGMGLPTIAAYAIPAAVVVPALIRMGVPEMAAHMFVLYYACLSNITPPVALAAYAAASIARTDPMKLSLVALRIGLSGFIIPFMFVYGPELLLTGAAHTILLATATACLGVFALSIAITGYFLAPVSPVRRLLFFAIALVLIKPGLLTDMIGLVGFILMFFWERRGKTAAPSLKQL